MFIKNKNIRFFLLFLFTVGITTQAFPQVTVTQRARNYIACPGAEVTLGVVPQAGVTYFWYNVPTGGTALNYSSSNTYMVASVAPPQTFWVEPRIGSTSYTRVAITINLSPYCGLTTPTNCAATGTLIYKEDFRGNNPSDPRNSPVDLIGGYSDLFFAVNPTSGGYSLTKHHSAFQFLYNDDHTYANDTTRGYYMYIDPAPSQMNAILYQYDILGLCSSISNMAFTVWAADLHCIPGNARPKLEMQILDKNTGDILVTTGTFMMPRQSGASQNPSNPVIWRQYGFNLNLSAGVGDITFRVINKEVNNIGNDWAMDDIEIHLCIPPVRLNIRDTSVCRGTPVTIGANYTDSGTFGNPLTYRWEYSATGNINNPAEWITLTTSTGTSPLNVTYTIASMDIVNIGYYRLVVGNSTTINQPNCRAVSAPVKIDIIPAPSVNISVSKNDVCTGVSVTFTAIPSESAISPLYQWVKNGVNIPGATLSTYTYAPADGDVITCRMITVCGEVTP